MNLFTCTCQWKYLVGKKNVYGPITPGYAAYAARMISRERWQEEYGDCAAQFEKGQE
jgi:hypothetical protein